MEPFDLRYVAPGTPEYEQAKGIRYECLYGEWGLPETLVEDTDGRTYVHLAAVIDEHVVGYARLHLQGGDSKLFQVCVTERWRGHGIARALVLELIGLARRQGRRQVYLDARTHVIGMYEKLGFAVEGDEFLSPRTGTPHRVMRLLINPA
ncbi:MAG: GNAT family N-acetyltransferase [Actinomycetota bacterium]|nr:GNAT family N-acetyltransferase [Actinomycetota bacterium]